MAVIFNSNFPGQSVGIAVEGQVAPMLYSITTASRSAQQPTPFSTKAKAIGEALIDDILEVSKGLQQQGNIITGALTGIFGVGLDALGTIVGKTAKDIYNYGVNTNVVKAISRSFSEESRFKKTLSKEDRPTEQSYFAIAEKSNREFSIEDMLKDLGYVVSIEGTYDEKVDYNVDVITAVPSFKLGRYVIRGVCFAGGQDNNGGFSGGRVRHGIEGVLRYYGFTRLSNDKNKNGLTVITLRIGNTTIPRAYVVGLDFQPAEPTSRVWSWSLVLAVQANILAPSLPGDQRNCS